MKIFLIEPDFNFWTVLPARTDFFSFYLELFEAKPMSATWDNNEAFYVYDPVRTQRSDFLSVSAAGTFGFSSKVIDGPLGDVLKKSGEVLSGCLDVPPVPIYFFNALACYNCLDHAHCVPKLAPGDIQSILSKYAIYPERIGNCNLFKMPESYFANVFTITGRDDPLDDFYTQYHACGFTGLIFREVWTDENSV